MCIFIFLLNYLYICTYIVRLDRFSFICVACTKYFKTDNIVNDRVKYIYIYTIYCTISKCLFFFVCPTCIGANIFAYWQCDYYYSHRIAFRVMICHILFKLNVYEMVTNCLFFIINQYSEWNLFGWWWVPIKFKINW